jgi:hypothetical protein
MHSELLSHEKTRRWLPYPWSSLLLAVDSIQIPWNVCDHQTATVHPPLMATVTPNQAPSWDIFYVNNLCVFLRICYTFCFVLVLVWLFCLFCFVFFERGSFYVVQASLEFEILLPQPPGCWNYRQVFPCLVLCYSFVYWSNDSTTSSSHSHRRWLLWAE